MQDSLENLDEKAEDPDQEQDCLRVLASKFRSPTLTETRAGWTHDGIAAGLFAFSPHEVSSVMQLDDPAQKLDVAIAGKES